MNEDTERGRVGEQKRHIEIWKAWVLRSTQYIYIHTLYVFVYIIWFWSFCIPFLNLLKILCEINQIVDVRFALALAFLWFIQQSCVQSNEQASKGMCTKSWIIELERALALSFSLSNGHNHKQTEQQREIERVRERIEKKRKKAPENETRSLSSVQARKHTHTHSKLNSLKIIALHDHFVKCYYRRCNPAHTTTDTHTYGANRFGSWLF